MLTSRQSLHRLRHSLARLLATSSQSRHITCHRASAGLHGVPSAAAAGGVAGGSCVPSSTVGSSLCRCLATASGALLHEKPWDVPDREVVIRELDNEGYLLLDVAKRPCYPLLKNIFCANFIAEVLEFPEVLSKEQVDRLEAQLSTLGYSSGGWSEPPSLHSLYEQRLLAAEVPHRLGGLSYTLTESVRLAEALATSGHALALAAHALVVQAVKTAGSEEQQQHWLPVLACGGGGGVNSLATACTAEASGTSDLAAVRCLAQPVSTSAGQSADASLSAAAAAWQSTAAGGAAGGGGVQCDLRLSGEKVAVAAAAEACYLLVTAKIVESANTDADQIGNVEPSVLLVDREAGGVTVTPYATTPGLYTVRFEDTPVPHANILGEVGSAYTVLLAPYSHSRVLSAALTAGMLRQLANRVVRHCVERASFGRHMSDFCLPRCLLAQMTAHIYSLESMVYTTAAIHDLSEEADYVLEAAACHVHASHVTSEVTAIARRLLGTTGQTRTGEAGELLQRCCDFGSIMSRYTASEDMTKLFIGLEGIKFTANFHAADLRILRNPVDNPLDSMKSTFRRLASRQSQYKYDVDSFLHPSLKGEAEMVSEMLVLFGEALTDTMYRNGNELMNQQTVLVWLSDAVRAIFVACATLARASRSYCIGLQDAAVEINLARAKTKECHILVKQLSEFIKDNPVRSPDRFFVDASDRIVELGNCDSAHPLSRIY